MLLYKMLIAFALADTPRIESKHIDLSSASKVYLKPGLVSVFEFPQNVIEVRVGNPNELKVLVSQVSPRELTVYFKNSRVLPSNIIVRSDKKVYVFDVIPSTSRHQDFIKIRGGFSAPIDSTGLTLIENVTISPSSKRNSERNELNRKLIEKVTL